MVLVLHKRHALYVLGIILMGAMLAVAYFGGFYARGGISTPVAFETAVCGPFEKPQAVFGVPVAAAGEYVTFEDGYVLRRDKEHSYYANRPGMFMLNGSENSYALVDDASYHPCPAE